MKKKVIFESIFILLLIILVSYLIFATILGSTFPLSPANNTNLSTTSSQGFFEYNFTCNHTTIIGTTDEIQNASLWADWSGTFSQNLTNKTSLKWANASVGYNVSHISDGTYIWACRTEYINGTIDKSTNYTVTIDTTYPVLVNLTNASWISNNTGVGDVDSIWSISSSAVATDTNLVNCSLSHDISGAWAANNVTNGTVVSGSKFTFSQAAKAYIPAKANTSGYHLQVICVDNTNHTRASNVTLFVDGNYPTGSISTINSTAVNPIFTNWSDETVNISANAGDIGGSGITNCTLWEDFTGVWRANQTKAVSNETNFDFTRVTLATNTTGYNYNVLCRDAANNKQNLSEGAFVTKVDGTVPTASVSSSNGNILSIGGITTLTCTAGDDVSIKTVTLTAGGTTLCSQQETCSKSYTMATSTSKTITCTVEDQVGHSVSSSLTLSTSDGGSGGGSGGGSSGGGSSSITEEESTTISEEPTTVTSSGGAGTIIPLTITGQNYNLEIKSVGIASVTVSLADNTLSMIIGETKETDLNKDGTNDIAITLNSISDNKPQFTIKEIKLQTAATEEGIGNIEEKKAGISTPLKIGLIIFGLIAIIITILILRNRKR